jgi:hypothetical protein
MAGDLEQLYLDARDLRDRQRINAARGEDDTALDARAAAAFDAAAEAINAAGTAATGEERRALEIMRAWAQSTDADDGGEPEPDEPWALTAERGIHAMSRRIEEEYAVAQGAIRVDDVTLTRLAVLERLGIEPDPARRKRLFYALEPVWQSIDGSGDSAADSPYQRMLSMSADGDCPVERNAAALGLTAADVEAQLRDILAAWRMPGTETEPWDWWYACGAAARALHSAAPLHRIMQINKSFYASLGADPDELDIGFDVFSRAGRPLIPLAYTDFGGRPRRRDDGTRLRAKPWVMGTYTAGGLGELTELVHETGHAIHVAAIDARPAFADWPDSDAFTEGLAELTGMDTAEPAWQEHWLGVSVPEAVSLRARYAEIMLDVCWALLEIRLHADPDQVPNDVWTELTSTYLGIAPHPELSWWAMRGQLVQEPGYMVNYALGPIITADLRAHIRAARGDWSAGDCGWYEYVADRVYRWGLERTCGDVLTDVLGRPVSADALIRDIGRAG